MLSQGTFIFLNQSARACLSGQIAEAAVRFDDRVALGCVGELIDLFAFHRAGGKRVAAHEFGHDGAPFDAERTAELSAAKRRNSPAVSVVIRTIGVKQCMFGLGDSTHPAGNVIIAVW
jgi:hypothetical protein